MTDVENRLRDALTDSSWDLAAPADPVAWVSSRVTRDRRRRAAVALPLCAALLIAGTAFTAAWLQPGRGGSDVAAGNPGEWSTVRDDLTMTVRLSNAAPVVGEQVTGSITVTNRRPDAVEFLDPCGRAPTLLLDYAAVIPTPRGTGTDPVAQFVQQVTDGTPSPGAGGSFFTPALGAYQVADRTASQCGRDESPMVLAPGASTVREVAWTVGSPNGTAVDAELPVRAIFTYLLAPGPDGTPVPGDPSSKGSTTPSARLLDLKFALGLHGGDPGRPGVAEIIQAAADDPAFADVLRSQPRDTWRFGWALTQDKPSTANALSFGELDTDPMLTTASRWYVALVYRTSSGTMRTTAQVDGASGRVISVNTSPEAAG